MSKPKEASTDTVIDTILENTVRRMKMKYGTLSKQQ
jgi:hypothetical protein